MRLDSIVQYEAGGSTVWQCAFRFVLPSTIPWNWRRFGGLRVKSCLWKDGYSISWPFHTQNGSFTWLSRRSLWVAYWCSHRTIYRTGCIARKVKKYNKNAFGSRAPGVGKLYVWQTMETAMDFTQQNERACLHTEASDYMWRVWCERAPWRHI